MQDGRKASFEGGRHLRETQSRIVLPVQALMVNNVTFVAFNVTILMTIFLVFAADEIIATYSEGDVLFDGNFGA